MEDCLETLVHQHQTALSIIDGSCAVKQTTNKTQTWAESSSRAGELRLHAATLTLAAKLTSIIQPGDAGGAALCRYMQDICIIYRNTANCCQAIKLRSERTRVTFPTERGGASEPIAGQENEDAPKHKVCVAFGSAVSPGGPRTGRNRTELLSH